MRCLPPLTSPLEIKFRCVKRFFPLPSLSPPSSPPFLLSGHLFLGSLFLPCSLDLIGPNPRLTAHSFPLPLPLMPLKWVQSPFPLPPEDPLEPVSTMSAAYSPPPSGFSSFPKSPFSVAPPISRSEPSSILTPKPLLRTHRRCFSFLVCADSHFANIPPCHVLSSFLHPILTRCPLSALFCPREQPPNRFFFSFFYSYFLSDVWSIQRHPPPPPPPRD